MRRAKGETPGSHEHKCALTEARFWLDEWYRISGELIDTGHVRRIMRWDGQA